MSGELIDSERFAEVVRQCITEGLPVELDGLGTLLPHAGRGIEFIPGPRPKVFIGYVDEELPKAIRLFNELTAAGMDPWLDKRKLLPGQDWLRAIERAISVADFVVPCFSRRATHKRCTFHFELRSAIEIAAQMPLDDIFMIPVRFDDCVLPRRIRSQIQYLDLFPDWDPGVARLISAIRDEVAARIDRRDLAA